MVNYAVSVLISIKHLKISIHKTAVSINMNEKNNLINQQKNKFDSLKTAAMLEVLTKIRTF